MQTAVEVFHLSKPLYKCGTKPFQRASIAICGREGDGCMKDTDHRARHPRVHYPDRASARRKRGCARQKAQFGRGVAPSWAGATPLLAAKGWPKRHGVAPARKQEKALFAK